jgi:AraC-like DNA-binding protein
VQLEAYKRYETRDPETAEAEVAKLLSPGHLVVRAEDRPRFAALASLADTGPVGIGFMRYGAATTIERRASSPYVGVAIPLTGHMKVWLDGRPAEVRAGASMAVIGANDPLRFEWAEGCDVLVLRVSTAFLASTARAFRDDELPLPARSAHRVFSLARGHALCSAASLLVETLGRYRSTADVPRGLLHLLAEHACSALLLGLAQEGPTTARRPHAAPSDAVRSAIRLIDEERAAELNVGELARHVGVSVRALELGFRRALDETPHQYMVRTRLRKAHRDLLAADVRDGRTVTEIAARWGFFHPGRFAARYQAVYGVAPSTSLRSPTA